MGRGPGGGRFHQAPCLVTEQRKGPGSGGRSLASAQGAGGTSLPTKAAGRHEALSQHADYKPGADTRSHAPPAAGAVTWPRDTCQWQTVNECTEEEKGPPRGAVRRGAGESGMSAWTPAREPRSPGDGHLRTSALEVLDSRCH